MWQCQQIWRFSLDITTEMINFAVVMLKVRRMKREINMAVKALWIVLVWAVLPASAQRFVNVSLDGSQTVFSITQDKMGLMWLGTENGLYCYDGYHGYPLSVQHTASLSRVNAMSFKGDSLYLATGNGLLVYDVMSNHYLSSSIFERYRDLNQRKLLREQRVVNGANPHARYDNGVYALLHTPKGLLIGTISGLYLETDGSKETSQALKNPSRKIQIPIVSGKQPLVNALAYDSLRNCYWVGTEGALYRADLSLRTFSPMEALGGNSVKCLTLDGESNLYVGTDNGLYAVSGDGAVTHYIHNSLDAYSIPNNIVWSCYVDKWQNVWVGTDNGLSRLVTFAYYQYFPWESITKSGEGNCLHAILQDKSGGWWLGGTNGLVHTFGGDVAWFKQNNRAFPLAHNRVRKFYEDCEGDVWVATDHGFHLYDKETHRMHNVIVYDKSGKYSTVWAYDVLEDRMGRMWLASYMGGIFVIDKRRLKQAATEARGTLAASCVADGHISDVGANALAGLHVGQLVMDGEGMIWASSNLGLDRINPNDGKVSHVKDAGYVSYLMVDHEGCVWTGGSTVVRCYDGIREVKEWKMGAKVSCMADVEGSVWVVSGKVCSVFTRHGKTMRFKIPEVEPLAIYYSAHKKRVVMGGNDGFVSVDARIVQPRGRLTPLMLTNVVVNGNRLQCGRVDSLENIPTKLAPRYLDKLTLASDENNFTLQLSDLPFANHASDVYAYRLEGSDKEWQFLNADDIDITYNGLPYGDYHLTVHVVDGEGKVGDEVYSLDISILPPWYLTIWAKSFYLLLVILLAVWAMNFYMVRKRLAEERRQKAEILAQVETRMNFFKNLSQRLKDAVTHRSFEEITELVKNSLDVSTTVSPSGPATASNKGMLENVENASGREEMNAFAENTDVAEKALDEDPKAQFSESDQRLLTEVTEAIETHMIDSDFNVTTLQEIVGIGSKQLYRKVKAMTGMTPVEYIREMRMRKASMMLNEGKFSVSEVMYTVGFSNSSYFSKCFSKAFGMTPTEYMRK